MSSYAPLFAHVDAWQWTPNLIWFDNLRSPSARRATTCSSCSASIKGHDGAAGDDQRLRRRTGQDGLFASAVARCADAASSIVKLVNPGARRARRAACAQRRDAGPPGGRRIVLTGEADGRELAERADDHRAAHRPGGARPGEAVDAAAVLGHGRADFVRVASRSRMNADLTRHRLTRTRSYLINARSRIRAQASCTMPR